MKPKLYLILLILALAALGFALWPRSGGQDDTASRADGYSAPVDLAVPHVASVPDPAPFEEQAGPVYPTLFGHPPGLTLAQQNELRQPELIQNVPPEVIEHARTHGFPFEGVIVSVVTDNGFWLIAHDPVDSYMWAAENRPIHPEDPARLQHFQPGDRVRGTIFHGDHSYILRLE